GDRARKGQACFRLRNTAERPSQFARALSLLFATICGATFGNPAVAQQIADPDFDASVKSPAFTHEHPLVSVDEAHHNFHTVSGRYAPLAGLLKNDGYVVQPGTTAFSAGTLAPLSVLIISNALGGTTKETAGSPAFTDQECDAVLDWVRKGGSLLLIADHAPMGGAAANLAVRFGVTMGKGYVFDLSNSTGDPTSLLFDRQNGLLGDHAIVRGRGNADTVTRVVAFLGQSLSVPTGATVLLRLGKTAYEANTLDTMDVALRALGEHRSVDAIAGLRPVQNSAQAIALNVDRGRVVIAGEAAMFTAQVVRIPNEPEVKAGMNSPGNDDKWFALNVMRWLSRAL
ncbi:MAG TPA: DUF4350 domain-containing protein, partial [Gammaproteobacteria bacterium]|nr:DUF4350 domain-containing protein [Gammaproteobacteria bacterium]